MGRGRGGGHILADQLTLIPIRGTDYNPPHYYSPRLFDLPTALQQLLRIQKKIKRGLMTTKNEKVGLPPFDAAPPISGGGLVLLRV